MFKNIFKGNLFKGDMVVWTIFLLLCVVSAIEVFSASSTLSFRSGDHWKPISGHLTLMAVGIFITWIIQNIPCKMFWKGVILLPVSWILLVYVLVKSVAINGASRWIDLGIFQFQPSELAKMATVLVVAKLLAIFQRDERSADPQAWKWIAIVTIPTVVLIGKENFSTAILLIGTIYLMMFIGRIPMKQMLVVTGVGAGLLILGIVAVMTVPLSVWKAVKLDRVETWKARVENFSKKEEVPPAKYNIVDNAQVAYANIAIATSHIVGKGPGNSVERDFLPQAFSDFIYAIIIEELGLIGGAFVAFLYIFLLIRIGKIARQCNKPFYAFLVMGIGILMVMQAMFNMLVAVGIMPVTGQPLPLISKGGTSTLVNCAYIGIILSVSHYVEQLKLQEELQQQADNPEQQVNPEQTVNLEQTPTM